MPKTIKSVSTSRRCVSKYTSTSKPRILKTKKETNTTNWWTYFRIYRKTISNLKIREKILSNHELSDSMYKIGPTLIWTENTADLDIFTTAENYTNYLSFDAPFNVRSSPKYLKRLLLRMRMEKGTILIKETTPENATNIPVHFCAYRIDQDGIFHIFDPSWN